jgi:tyrosine aminotransferase
MNSLPDILDKLTIFYARDRMKHFKKNHDYLVREFNSIRGLKCIPAQGTIYLAVLIDTTELKVKNDTEFA